MGIAVRSARWAKRAWSSARKGKEPPAQPNGMRPRINAFLNGPSQVWNCARLPAETIEPAPASDTGVMKTVFWGIPGSARPTDHGRFMSPGDRQSTSSNETAVNNGLLNAAIGLITASRRRPVGSARIRTVRQRRSDDHSNGFANPDLQCVEAAQPYSDGHTMCLIQYYRLWMNSRDRIL